MEERRSMTALISAFARAYHSAQYKVKIFDDTLAKELIGQAQYSQVAMNMAKGIEFFKPGFDGTEEEALRWIVNSVLSPTPLGRAAFAESSLKNAVAVGATQYVVLGSGYDTFGLRAPDWARSIKVFELDREDMHMEKRRRIENLEKGVPENLHLVGADLAESSWTEELLSTTAFSVQNRTFWSMLGLVYYLPKRAFAELLGAVAGITPRGSSLVFDYPNEKMDGVQNQLANAASEKMYQGYSYREMEQMLADNGFLIYEFLAPDDVTRKLFHGYNRANPTAAMEAGENINYCLAVKK